MLSAYTNNLIKVCDSIIQDHHKVTSSQATNEYSKNGKKYRLTSNGDFIRVHDESKHLIVSSTYQDFSHNYSILSAYHILQSCGTFLRDYKTLALAILFTSREIELNKWYDETSKIGSIENCSYDIFAVEDEALMYISKTKTDTRTDLIHLGSQILVATKINYFQTDHNVTSPNLEGYALRQIISDNCGTNALSSPDVFNALRAFSHWCSVTGIFYNLGLPNVAIDQPLVRNFNSFPPIPKWISDTVYGRYPAGCSKLALVNKSLTTISNSVYGRLIVPPSHLDPSKVFSLAAAVEADPLTYRLRSGTSNYSTQGYKDISQLFTDANEWVVYISCVLRAISGYRMPSNMLLSSSKILKIEKVRTMPAFKQTMDLVNRIKRIEKNSGYNNKVSDERILSLLGGEVQYSLSSYAASR